MRPVVGCAFFLFFCFLASAPVVRRSAAQAASTTRAAKAALGRGICLDLLRRCAEVQLFGLPAAVAAAGARADGEQARAEEEERDRLWHGVVGYVGRRRGRGRRVAAGADAAHTDERDADERPPREAALRNFRGRRNLAAVADRAGHV